MANTHALQEAGVDSAHWLRSDLWLPNGWATVVFVVLSGYGAGYVFSARLPASDRDRALRRRGTQILFVMLASNLLFAGLRDVQDGDLSMLLRLNWWLGFLTLESQWTISGVLLPTGLVVLLAPRVIRFVERYPRMSLAQLVLCSLAVAALAIWSSGTVFAQAWLVRILLLEGLGGFPVLPFLLNGCLGIWLGIFHRRSPHRWISALAALMGLQVIVYLSTFLPYDFLLAEFRALAGALGKFGWMFFLALVLTRSPLRLLASPIEKIGRFALGSFVVHRVFLQSLAIGMGAVSVYTLPAWAVYAFLFGGTLLLTWLLCEFRQRSWWLDTALRRLAM